ncbi:MAG: hypothetical protein R3E44_15655 [Paracoccaceae bacterium]
MCPKDSEPPSSAHYLVVVHDGVVLSDLAQTIAEFDPAAPVIAVTSPSEALRKIDSAARLAVAFIEMSPSRFAGSALAAAIAARRGRVIYLGDAAEDEADTVGAHLVLQRPFTPDIVFRYLALLT